MDPTQRRRRRRSNGFEPPALSGDSSRENIQVKRQRREDKEELKSARELEMKKIQEFVQRFPDQQKETESSVRELKNIAAYIRNDKDALVDGTPATSLIRRGAAVGAAGVAAGVAMAPFTFGASLAVSAAAAGTGAAIASKGASALKDYNKKLEEIRENASSRMTELGRSATTAIVAVLNLKRLSGLSTAADPDYEKVFEMLKTDSPLRDLIQRMEELLGASTADTADSEIDKIAETIFPYDLVGFMSLFSIILSFNIKNQKNEKARKIHDCAVKLEKNLQAGREIQTAMKKLCN
ncbi:uncharacterized protein LOC131736674 [Acipenser ruthenus]|uniref:uncharacterized protein LOC131736674 n=1 Tax=Acipenser ruthenus TaxID=7906 RepID=UPI0027403D46|nr:uncharacterized protein LOC131736674 [Acipenser ruthenus]XP_058877918.1 uncharacterized protein LOC131736674 [Acipenser ruthenus]XP_058877919.1 uncharacterized protein LOC131736674 [Acipenser ruthenus]